jgi:uncharacterized Zn finger protein (UPF0148 family)
MSKLHDMDAGNTTTEYQETVMDPDIGEPTQVQCANCGAWRLNSRLYCPTCGARNVQSTSVFLTEEEILAKAGMSADELRATISQPKVEKSKRRMWLIGGFIALLAAGWFWAHQARQEALQTKQMQEAETQAQTQAAALAAEKAREAASAAKAAEAALAAQQALAAASAAQAAASAPVLLSDEQATKLGLNTPAPKPRKLEPAPVVAVTPSPAPAAPTAPAPEPAKPEPKPVAVVAPKVETPQERLAIALSACKGKGGFFERNACEFNARKQYCPGIEGTVRDCPISRSDL